MRLVLSWMVFFAVVGLILWSYAEPALEPVAGVLAFALLAVGAFELVRAITGKWRGLPRA